MDNSNINKHISGQFNQELEHVRSQVLAMGGLVEKQLVAALDAVVRNDAELAQEVILGDAEVNALEVNIDEATTRIIAKRQPAAVDLRLTMAIARTCSDLERIGDMAERIAQTAKGTFTKQQMSLLVSLDSLGQHVVSMLHDVLDAFARMDVDAAWRVHEEDERVDQKYEGVMRQMMTYMMEDPRSIPVVMEVLFAVRSLERVGDRCKNIAEYVIYFVKGKDVRHTSPEQVNAIVKGK